MAENDGLLELAQAAKRAGAEGLYRAYSSRIFGFVLRLLDDAHAAQDVTVEAFKTAFREVVTFTSASGFLLKLYQKAFEEAERRALSVAAADPGWRDVEEVEAFAAEEEKLQAALKGVPPWERGLWLLQLEGLTEVEVAFAAGLDVKQADTGPRVTDGIALAKRHFLAGLSTTPAHDGAKASEVADRLGLMFKRRPAPPQVWATIDRTLRAERIVADDAPPPRRAGRGIPWVVVIGVLAVIGLVVVGLALRRCSPETRAGRAERTIVVGVHEGRAGVWWIIEGTRHLMPSQNLQSEADPGFEDRLLDWTESWRKRSAAFDLKRFNTEGRALAEQLRVRMGTHMDVRFEAAE